MTHRHSSLDSEDSQKSDALKNFEANLEPMSFLIKHLGPTEVWRSAKSLSRVVNSCTKAGSVDTKSFERLMRAGSKLNENLEIYTRTINFRYEWLGVMLVTFLEAYLKDLRTEVQREFARRLPGGGGPDIWVERMKNLGAREYSNETLLGVIRHLLDTRNLIIHSQGLPDQRYSKKYPNQDVMEGGRVKITPGQLKVWMEAVRDFMKPTDIFFLTYRAPESERQRV